MRLYEHEGKALFARYGIPIPRSTLVREGETPPRLTYPAMLKAQLLRGGRARAGAVLEALDAESVARLAPAMLALEVDGEKPAAVLVEERVAVAAELYLAMAVDRVARRPVVLFSDQGGIMVEEAEDARLTRVPVNPLVGVRPYMARTLVGSLGRKPGLAPKLWGVLQPLAQLFDELGCELAEINPLGLTEDGRLVALDAKLEVDDKAAALQPELRDLSRPGGSAWERRAAAYGMSASELGGAIRVVTGGAGITMATGDLVRAAGGSLAAVIDLQNAIQGREDRAVEALRIIREGPGCVTFFNFYMQVADGELYARAITAAFGDCPEPVMVRLYGNRAAEGRALLREEGFRVVEGLQDGVRGAVELETARARS